MRRDLQATSSQDEFARWAKLRRQHDKMLEQLEKMSACPSLLNLVEHKRRAHRTQADTSYAATELGLDGSRAKFDKYVSTTRWVSTRGMKWFLPFWYSREPMFWLPHGWFPYYAEWLISFPRAPMGSVSVVSWQLGCAAVISLISDTIGAIVRLVLDAQQKETPQKQPMRASSPVSGEKKPSVGEGKKFS